MSLQVLLIEDDEAHAELVQRALRNHGCGTELHIADTLAEARRYLAGAIPDVILADINLPDGSALNLLPGDPDRVKWPVVVLTGVGDESVAVASLKAGAIDYVVKSRESVTALPAIIQRATREWAHIARNRAMQADLAESEERFRHLFDTSPVGTAILDDELRVVRVNEALCQLLGYAEAEFVGKMIIDFALPEDRQLGLDRIAQLEGEHHSVRYEKRYQRKDGSVVWVEVCCRRTRARQAMPRNIILVLQDVTETRQYEQALRESEERQRLAMTAANMGTWEWDPESNHIYWSAQNYLMLGYVAGAFELSYASWLELLHPEDAKAADHEVKGQIHSHNSFNLELRVRGADGNYRWINHRGKVVRWSEAGNPLRVVGTNMDIDDRVQAEHKLQEGNRRLHALFDDANDAIIVSDSENGAILEVNQSAERLMGMSRGELVGSSLVELLPEAQRNLFRQQVKGTEKGADRYMLSTELSTRVRGVVPVEVRASRIWFPSGKQVVMGIYRDISERCQLEAQLRQAQKMEAIGQLAGGVAHDFNNVIGAIMLQLGMLKTDPRIPVDLKNSLSMLEASSKRAADLTRQLLLFGRRQPMKLQLLDLDVLLTNLLKMLRRLIGENKQLDFTGQPNLHWLEADPGMIEQVVVNMVMNARDAMGPGGRIQIESSLVEGQMPAPWSDKGERPLPGRYLKLSILDNGSGMDDETQRKLFEPFFTTKEQGKGTGLGLATIYGIIKQHQGWIEVQSKPGSGSRFDVFLPARMPPAPAAQGTEGVAPFTRGSETILLVEDEHIVRTFTALALRSAGYTVIEAGDGEEALQKWEQYKRRIHVLVTDMIMPKSQSGWDIAKIMRAETPGLAVVLTSGYSADIPKEAMDNEYKMFFLQKPFDGTRLTAALRGAVALMR